jgi:hypothetical protein
MYGGILRIIMHATNIKRRNALIFSRAKETGGEGHLRKIIARRARADQRWDAFVRAGGGQPRSNAVEGRSLDVNKCSWRRADPKGGELEEGNRAEKSGTVW